MKPEDNTMQQAATVIADAPRSAPLLAAKGDDGLMSTPPLQLPSRLELKGRWAQHVGAAKVAWAKLTEDELLKVEGHVQQLSGLIQERYAVTRDAAEQQIRDFYYKHKP